MTRRLRNGGKECQGGFLLSAGKSLKMCEALVVIKHMFPMIFRGEGSLILSLRSHPPRLDAALRRQGSFNVFPTLNQSSFPSLATAHDLDKILQQRIL